MFALSKSKNKLIRIIYCLYITYAYNILKSIIYRIPIIIYNFLTYGIKLSFRKPTLPANVLVSYVIGSGSSLNTLSSEELDKINSSECTIGSGKLLIDDRISPSHYISECASTYTKTLEYYSDFKKILCLRKNDILDMKIFIKLNNQFINPIRIIKLKNLFPKWTHRNIYFFFQCLTPHGSIENFKLQAGNKSLLKFFNFIGAPSACRSNNVLATMLCISFEHKKIYLVGNDGYTGYFADNTSNNEIFDSIENKYIGDKNRVGALHSTYDVRYGSPTVDKCFQVLSDCYKSIYVRNPSVISRYIPNIDCI